MSQAPQSGALNPDWRPQIYAVAKEHGITHMAYVPDAGHSIAIKQFEADPDITSVLLTTEEEGIAYLAGASLGGARGILLMQSSGVGNCINMLSLTANARFPLLMVVTMRGEWSEFNAWQVPMGRATEPALHLTGVQTWRAERAEDVKALLSGAAEMAFNGDQTCAVLLGQQLIGKKKW